MGVVNIYSCSVVFFGKYSAVLVEFVKTSSSAKRLAIIKTSSFRTPASNVAPRMFNNSESNKKIIRYPFGTRL